MESSAGTYDDQSRACQYCGTNYWLAIGIASTVIAILGNVLTLFAILFSKKLSSLTANYFVFSLAVSDLMVGCSLPYHMLFYLVQDFGKTRTICLLRFALTCFACSSSICNLLFIAMDRYLAIVYPLHYTRFMTKKTAYILISVGWLLATSTASTPLVWNEWYEGVSCEVVYVFPFSFIKYVLCPMFVMIWTTMLLLYSRICKEASGHQRRLRGSANLNQLSSSFTESKSFQVMMIILGCFTICWLPYLVITIYARTAKSFQSASLYEIFFNLAMANSCMNPLIYAWKNTNFRKAFLCLVKCRTPDHTSANFITNHLPSQRNSMNGICNISCQTEGTNVDVEIQMELVANEKKFECSVVSPIEREISRVRTTN
nr:5-hydroxytryptamine receptor 1A-like [Leptinotarsa decemlineata]